MPEDAQGRYEAVQTDETGETRLGTVVLDGQGRMQAEGGDERLADLVERMNGKSVMHVEAPPPEGAPRFTLSSRIVRRGEPDFIAALQDYLRTYYKVELTPR